MRLTLDEIYREGLRALRDRLGRAGMVRFLQQFETGGGDYQALINAALRSYIQRAEEPIENILRRVIREEMRRAS